jgi:hypothetical protein
MILLLLVVLAKADYQTTGGNASVSPSRQSMLCQNGYYWGG